MKKTIKTIEIPDAFILFNEAMAVFNENGMASYHGQLGMVEYCARYIANQDKKMFLEDTRFDFGFESKDITKIIRNYKKTKKELCL